MHFLQNRFLNLIVGKSKSRCSFDGRVSVNRMRRLKNKKEREKEFCQAKKEKKHHLRTNSRAANDH